jgi:hypothetical protein
MNPRKWPEGDGVLAVDGPPLATRAAGRRTAGGSATRGGMECCRQPGDGR